MCSICAPSSAESFLPSLPLRKRQQHWQTPQYEEGLAAAHKPLTVADKCCSGCAWATCYPHYEYIWGQVVLAPSWASAVSTENSSKFCEEMCPNSQMLLILGRQDMQGMSDAIHVTLFEERSVFEALFPNLLSFFTCKFIATITSNTEKERVKPFRVMSIIGLWNLKNVLLTIYFDSGYMRNAKQ